MSSDKELTHREKWYQAMVKKHGSEAAVREYMRQAGNKAKRSGTGGFAYLKANDPDKLRAISSAAGKKSTKGKPSE